MKIPTIGAVVVCFALANATTATAELVTMTANPANPTNTIVLPPGDGAQLVYNGVMSGGTKVTVQTTNLTYSFDYNHTSSSAGSLAIGGPATITLSDNVSTAIVTFNITHAANPSTLNVIPKGQGAIVTLETTFTLDNKQWTTLFTQAYTNATPTNQFFKFTMTPF